MGELRALSHLPTRRQAAPAGICSARKAFAGLIARNNLRNAVGAGGRKLMATPAQLGGEIRGQLAFHHQLVRKPLVMNPGPGIGFEWREPEVKHVDEVYEDRGDNLGPAGCAQ